MVITTIAEEKELKIPPAPSEALAQKNKKYPARILSNPNYYKVNSSRSAFFSTISLARTQCSNKKECPAHLRCGPGLSTQSTIYVSEKCTKEGFKVIGCFVSAKAIARFLGTNYNTIIKFKNSGEIYKDRYKFT